MPTYDVFDTQGNLLHTEELPVDPVSPDDLIAGVAAMTDTQKADLRAALGL
jgi:hypothetical protein